MGDHNLVTTCNFQDQEYLFKLNILANNLEILITDKSSGEEWHCSYDATYVENLTHKTGNFKQFDIFVAMIKSGLLRTSESVSLDLLTFEDLELLRSRKIAKSIGRNNHTNRRYLIVTYAVEFDKIRYPLPLEYCGPPDPTVLQATIKRLEGELSRTREDLAYKPNQRESKKIYFLQKRVDDLLEENLLLKEEIAHLNKLLEKKNKYDAGHLQKAVINLEKSVVNERNSHHELVEKLRADKLILAKELEKVKHSERTLKERLLTVNEPRVGVGDFASKAQLKHKNSAGSVKVMYKISPERSRRAKDKYFLERQTSSDYSGWESPMIKKINKTKRQTSPSSSNGSTKFQDVYGSPSDESRYRRSRKTRLEKTRLQPRSRASSNSSGASQKSKKSPMRSKSIRTDTEYKKLENKIASLERIVKTSFRK